MKKFPLSLIALSTTAMISSFQSAHANQCDGQLYGINAGRGDTAIVFKLDEFNQDAQAHSRAKFSSSALAHVKATNRLYYVSAPRPIDYKVDVDHLDFNSTELNSLPISGSKFKYIKLAYVDLTTNEHVEVGRTKNMYRLTYDEQNNRLLGSYKNKLYQISPETAETTLLGEIKGLEGDKGIWRGDLVYKGSELVLVTSSSIYTVDIDTLTATKLSDHNLSAVTGAAINQQGEILLSKTTMTDLGHSNKSALYKVNKNTGNTCHVADFPVRINDLATNFNESSSCYAAPLCGVSDIPAITLSPVTDSVTEGNTLSYELKLSNTFEQDVEVFISTTPMTASASDYSYTNQTVVIPAGQTTHTITITTIDNDDYSDDKTFTLTATAQNNATGSISAPAYILNDDEQCIVENYTRINYSFVSEQSRNNNDWGIKVNGQYIKLLDEQGPDGYYDVKASDSITYVLAVNGDATKLKTVFKKSGNKQYWEDQSDNDFNDFVVSVSTQPIQSGCN
ncbi:hemolysin [Pseudoalteromonas shioyasakiensis]|uniref:Calx-beta domain-containing protein n=1 Tax=Pseudoalteromonas shioyasakiensis TaxID=1190813 RepID=UPI0021190E3F|nr:Calx-beta domain-containing protein [Pseudoalteromonas shioyasakiensis]MCQ8876743.1 hemolysin [Pseudoalteromonas shioyasakiensis]